MAHLRVVVLALAVASCGATFTPCKTDGSSLDCNCANLPGGKFIMNCGFLRKPRQKSGEFDFKNMEPALTSLRGSFKDWTMNNFYLTLQEMYLYENELTEIGPDALKEYKNLEVFNARYNKLTSLKNEFRRQTKLSELNVEDNQISIVDEQTFEFLTSLTILRLGSNKIQKLEVGTFASQKKLRILRLENNQLADLPAGLFDFDKGCKPGDECLQQLHLERNLLTRVHAELFKHLTALEELYLQVNPKLMELPPLLFKDGGGPAGSLLVGKLGMQGARSSCTKSGKAGNTIKCSCAAGFLDGSDQGAMTPAQRAALKPYLAGTYCTAIDCGSTIPDLPENGIAECDKAPHTFFEKDGTRGECPVTCGIGYEPRDATGSDDTKYECAADGKWVGTLKCEPRTCRANILKLHQNAKAVCKNDQLLFGGPPCVAKCNKGYLPADGTTEEWACGAGGEWEPYSKGQEKATALICEEIQCDKDVNGLNLDRIKYLKGTSDVVSTNCEEREYRKTCRVQCAEEYSAVTARDKPYVCQANGRWEAGVLGDLDCKGKKCPKNGPSNLPNGTVARCLGDVTFGGDDCGISCASGYVPVGVFKDRIQKYCSTYSEQCPKEFSSEFGDPAADSGLGICEFEAQRLTHGPAGDTSRDTNTISCRQNWLDSADAGKCDNARLFGKKTSKCAKKLCREGSLECLTCTTGSAADKVSGSWSGSTLTCAPITCQATQEAIKLAACLSKAPDDKSACEKTFDEKAHPMLSGNNCGFDNNFHNTCPISCDVGYLPKKAPFLCEANQVGEGLWLYEQGLDCKPIQCPIQIVSQDVAGNVKFADLDQNAVVVATTFDGKTVDQTILQDAGCPRGKFRDGTSANGTGCVPKAMFDPFAPTQLSMTCGAPMMPETYEIRCHDPSWEVVDRKYEFQTGDRFCRADCGRYPDSVSEQLVEECVGNAEGDLCNFTCKEDTNIKYEYLCDPFLGKWRPATEYAAVSAVVQDFSLCVDGRSAGSQECAKLGDGVAGRRIGGDSVKVGVSLTPKVARKLWKDLEDKCLELAASVSGDAKCEGGFCKSRLRSCRDNVHTIRHGAQYTTMYDEGKPTTLASAKDSKCAQLEVYRAKPTASSSSESSVSGGAIAGVVIFCLIVVFFLVVVTLYYFGYLKIFGLEVAKSKAQIYGQMYGDMYGALGGAGMGAGDLKDLKSAKKIEEFSGPRIAGRSKATTSDNPSYDMSGADAGGGGGGTYAGNSKDPYT